ncbi:MAG TPA: hypothetical protein VGD98_14125 [Ktedonobacteraceae bacterium]
MKLPEATSSNTGETGGWHSPVARFTRIIWSEADCKRLAYLPQGGSGLALTCSRSA